MPHTVSLDAVDGDQETRTRAFVLAMNNSCEGNWW